MRVAMWLVVSGVLWVAPAASAQDDNRWLLVGKDDDRRTLLDTKTVKRSSDDIVRAWLKSEYVLLQQDSDKKKYKSAIGLADYNCTDRRSRILVFTTYDASGNVVASSSREPDLAVWQDVVPQTYGETYLEFVCNYMTAVRHRSDTTPIRADPVGEAGR